MNRRPSTNFLRGGSTHLYRCQEREVGASEGPRPPPSTAASDLGPSGSPQRKVRWLVWASLGLLTDLQPKATSCTQQAAEVTSRALASLPGLPHPCPILHGPAGAKGLRVKRTNTQGSCTRRVFVSCEKPPPKPRTFLWKRNTRALEGIYFLLSNSLLQRNAPRFAIL